MEYLCDTCKKNWDLCQSQQRYNARRGCPDECQEYIPNDGKTGFYRLFEEYNKITEAKMTKLDAEIIRKITAVWRLTEQARPLLEILFPDDLPPEPKEPEWIDITRDVTARANVFVYPSRASNVEIRVFHGDVKIGHLGIMGFTFLDRFKSLYQVKADGGEGYTFRFFRLLETEK